MNNHFYFVFLKLIKFEKFWAFEFNFGLSELSIILLYKIIWLLFLLKVLTSYEIFFLLAELFDNFKLFSPFSFWLILLMVFSSNNFLFKLLKLFGLYLGLFLEIYIVLILFIKSFNKELYIFLF